MHIDWQPDGRPDAAHRIAEHTQRVIESMNRATSKSELKDLFEAWMRFARENRVCSKICEHMTNKRWVMLGDMDKPKRPAPPPQPPQDITKRMMGESE